jgi:hypothetical protein
MWCPWGVQMRCDGCYRASVHGKEGLEVKRRAAEKGWTTRSRFPSDGVEHLCPACSKKAKK